MKTEFYGSAIQTSGGLCAIKRQTVEARPARFRASGQAIPVRISTRMKCRTRKDPGWLNPHCADPDCPHYNMGIPGWCAYGPGCGAPVRVEG